MSASSSKLAQDECEVFEMNIGDRTENAISDILPLCVKEFEELLNSDKAKNHNSNENSTPYHHSLQSCGKKLSVGLGLLHNYITVEELIAMVKPTIYKLADAIKTIRVWILLHVPEAADCSNIQMEVRLYYAKFRSDILGCPTISSLSPSNRCTSKQGHCYKGVFCLDTFLVHIRRRC